MSIKKKIFVACCTFALIAAVSLTAVYASSTVFSTDITAIVSYEAQIDATVQVTIDGVVKTYVIHANGTTEGNASMNFGNVTFDSPTDTITTQIVVTNRTESGLVITITPTYNNVQDTQRNVSFSNMTTTATATGLASPSATPSGTGIKTFTQTMSIVNTDKDVSSVTQTYQISLSKATN